VSPHLSISGAADAIDFYKNVFGATERMRMGMPDGTVAHAELELDGSSARRDGAPRRRGHGRSLTSVGVARRRVGCSIFFVPG
jgi:PhnB protein